MSKRMGEIVPLKGNRWRERERERMWGRMCDCMCELGMIVMSGCVYVGICMYGGFNNVYVFVRVRDNVYVFVRERERERESVCG